MRKRISSLRQKRKFASLRRPKPVFEEKCCSRFCGPQFANFWRQELGENFLVRLKKLIPYPWLVDSDTPAAAGGDPRIDLTGLAATQGDVTKGAGLDLKVFWLLHPMPGARAVFSS